MRRPGSEDPHRRQRKFYSKPDHGLLEKIPVGGVLGLAFGTSGVKILIFCPDGMDFRGISQEKLMLSRPKMRTFYLI